MRPPAQISIPEQALLTQPDSACCTLWPLKRMLSRSLWFGGIPECVRKVFKTEFGKRWLYSFCVDSRSPSLPISPIFLVSSHELNGNLALFESVARVGWLGWDACSQRPWASGLTTYSVVAPSMLALLEWVTSVLASPCLSPASITPASKKNAVTFWDFKMGK